MNNKLQKYDNYKPSNVEWLGEIPQHWEVTRIKNLFKEINERSMNGNEDLLSVSQYTGVTKKGDKLEEGELLTNAATLEGYKKVFKGDLVSNIMLAWNGSLGFSEFEGITSPAYSIYRLKVEGAKKYFHYLFRTELYKSEFKRNSSGVIESRLRLYTDDFFRIPSILPPLSEQEKIAQFLDEKNTKIDKAIEIKERQIELLKERRQILIHRAVTRGLDVNVPLKDSGIEWIGEIPEHWEVKRLRYIGKCQNGVSKGAEYFGTGFPFVSYGDVYKSIELAENVNGLAESSIEDRKQYSVKEGDVFFTRTSETVEEIGFASTCLKTIEDATFAGFLIRFRPSKDILYKGFSKFYFSSKTHRAFFVKEMNLVIRASLSQELLNRMPIIIPPFEEQIAISEYLENISAKISKAIGLKEREIEVLKEYKSSLINSAVTGKVRVF
ncbi:restriction endonuclease subunit S [Emticicia sp. W12TSBA100-4]|uniref:restriction endonuclease subunit S n=1 Tax=Emticicia sp. W12TSBA100-4 TaxID=3160965 RepID=UPI003305728D